MQAQTYPEREHLSMEEAIRACARLTALGVSINMKIHAADKNPYYRNGTVFVRVSTEGSSIGYMDYPTIKDVCEAMIEEGFVPYFSASGTTGGYEESEGYIHIGTNVSLRSHEPQYGINDKR